MSIEQKIDDKTVILDLVRQLELASKKNDVQLYQTLLNQICTILPSVSGRNGVPGVCYCLPNMKYNGCYAGECRTNYT